MRVAVIGAGLAGLSCARALQGRGAIVTVFDKGRQPGGRVATRVVGAYTFNHGAPWLHDDYPGLGLMRWGGGWVGTGTMAELARQLAPGPVQCGRHVTFLTRDAAGWTVMHRDARQTAPGFYSAGGNTGVGPFDAVVLAIPAPQASAFLSAIGSPLAPCLAMVTMLPCLTLMAGNSTPGHFAAPRSRSDFAAMVQDSARPGQASLPECWTVHADARWSAANIDLPPAGPIAAMLSHLQTGDQPDGPAHATLHRWRYARTGVALGQPCLTGPDRLIVCGDWCLGPTTSDAIRSGQAAAAALS